MMETDDPRERGYDWSKKARCVRERHGHTCRRCFRNNITDGRGYTPLVVHHIVPGDQLPVDDARIDLNLVTVCAKCHVKLEEQPARLQFLHVGRVVAGAILYMLEEGRCTPAYIAEEVGVTQEYVRDRLSDLERLGLVNRVYRGLYELTEGEYADS